MGLSVVELKNLTLG